MTNLLDWYEVANIDEIDSPVLLVYKDRIEDNIKNAKTIVSHLSKLRPHVKTHKTPEIVRLMIEEGIEKFKCATITEAQMLGDLQVADVLLAYQPIGPKVKRFISLIKKYNSTNFSCLIDHLEAAAALSDIAVKESMIINVYLDINIGMNRTGTTPGLPAVNLFMDCLKLKGINVIGLHTYDGHITDRDFETRKDKCDLAYTALENTLTLINNIKEVNLKIVVGGSPTFPIHAKRENVECSPGTFVFWDKGYNEMLPEQDFACAALVATRIISLPNDTTICTDLGHKSIAAEMPLANRAIFLNAPELIIISHSEEHMTLQCVPGHTYKIGDVLYALPHHICPTVALYDKMAVVTRNIITVFWDITARKKHD